MPSFHRDGTNARNHVHATTPTAALKAHHAMRHAHGTTQ